MYISEVFICYKSTALSVMVTTNTHCAGADWSKNEHSRCKPHYLTYQLLHKNKCRQVSSWQNLHKFSFYAALCDDPVDIDRGTMTVNGNSVGDIATYICDFGFKLTGCTTTTCALVDMDTAEFQPTPPTCSREYTECISH